jgi:mannose-6-phosphate isomerase-like protein (cupin superfamily)
MQIIDIKKLPAVHFGQEIPREIRLVASPWTTGSGAVIVHVVVPPGAISEGHVHPDADEMILFTGRGVFAGQGRTFQVEAGTVVIVPKGETHECRNPSQDSPIELYCVFSPPFTPYGKYPELIEATKGHLAVQADDAKG